MGVDMVKVEISKGVYYARHCSNDPNGFELIEARFVYCYGQRWFWDASISFSAEDVAIVKRALADGK